MAGEVKLDLVGHALDAPKKPANPGEVKDDASHETQDTSPKGIGKRIETEFTSTKDRNLVAQELANSFVANFDKFSPEFQAAHRLPNGKPNMAKILQHYQLDNHLGSQFTATGAVIPPPQKDIDEKTSETHKFEFTGKMPPTSGSEFIKRYANFKDEDYGNSLELKTSVEDDMVQHILSGNTPSWCKPENMKSFTIDNGKNVSITFKASPDYLAIGNDNDFVRIQATPRLVAKLREHGYKVNLPTTAMAKTIYNQADIKQIGIGLPAGGRMQSLTYTKDHNDRINDQLGGADNVKKLLLAGHVIAGTKKDVILDSAAIGSNQVLIFGLAKGPGRFWQQNPGSQSPHPGYFVGKDGNPLALSGYADYSHGMRQIDDNLLIKENGKVKEVNYFSALKDPVYGPMLNGRAKAFNPYDTYGGMWGPDPDRKQAA